MTPTGQAYWCTACSTIKRETNHWHIAVIDSDQDGVLGLFLHDFDVKAIEDLQRFAGTDAGAEQWALACGERCVHTLVSRYLETRSFNPPPTRSTPATLPNFMGCAGDQSKESR